MTREEFNNKSFDELMEDLGYENTISCFEVLKEYAEECIKDYNFSLAIHILQALDDNMDVEWFEYDYSMGEMSTPKPIMNKSDLEEYID